METSWLNLVHVIHEALKESHVVDVAPHWDSCGNIAGLQTMRMRSPSVKDLNFGRMFPYMHVYAEDERIQEYALDMNPEYPPGSIPILDGDSDVDLGGKAWASFDDGVTGEAHAIIFDSTSIIESGTDERDGIQIKAFEAASPGVLGLETDGSSYYFSRNSYEKGTENDLVVPEDFVVEYDAEFYTTLTRGYVGVDKEAEIFQSLVKNRPSRMKEAEEVEIEKGDCSLTAFVHIAPSIPMGSTLAALTGMKFSFISAELYHNETFTSTGFSERLSLETLPSFADTKPLEKIKIALDFLDLRNFTFFKKVRFQNLESGTYLIKIYKENPLIGKERKFIGYKIVEVNSDTRTRIFCKPQGSVTVSVFDQNKNGVEDVAAQLMYDDTIISKSVTDQNGTTTVKAPCSLKDKYALKLTYKGFVIHEETIKLRYVRNFIPIKKSVDIELYDLKLKFKDILGLTPPYKLNPVLTSNEMNEPVSIIAEDMGDGCYLFTNLYPAEYQLEVKYKSFMLEENINIPVEKEEIEFVFPAEYDIEINVFDLPLEGTTIIIQRDGKKIDVNDNGKGGFSLPVGVYNVKVYLEDELVSERKINVMSGGNFDFVTAEEPVFPLIIICASVILAIFGAIFSFRRKDLASFLKILAISMAIISIISPWWVLHGSSTNPMVETTTSIFLTPAAIVTTTTTSNVIAGEVASASLPELLTTAITLLSIAIGIGCVLIALNMVFKRFGKNRLSFLSLLLGILSMIGSLTIFTFGISTLAKLGVGSFMGSGNIDVNIIGEGLRGSVYCNWGPNLGFILCLASIIVLLSILVFNIKKAISNRPKQKGRLLEKKNLIKLSKKLMPLIGIILLIYLIVSIGTDAIISTFLKISPVYVVIAALLTIPRVLIRNYGWQIILKKQKIFVSYLTSLKIFMISYFYGSVTPGYIGHLMKIPYLKEKTGEPTGKLFVNCFVEVAVHTLSLYFMMIIGAFLILDKIPEAFPFACIFLAVTLVIYWFFAKKERGEKTFHLLVQVFIPKKLKSHFTKFVDTFYTDFPNIKDLIYPFVVVIPTWIIIYSQIYILGLSLDIEVPYFAFLMLYPIANIVAFIPITPAGLGTREATLIFLFSFFGVSPEKTLVLSLAGHLLTDVLTGFYGFVISVVEARNNKKNFSDLKQLLEKTKQ